MRWRDSAVYRSGLMQEKGRDWLVEEGTPDWRWILCPACEREPLVMKEYEEAEWRSRCENPGAEETTGEAHSPPDCCGDAGTA